MNEPSFRHIYRPGSGPNPLSLLLLHGTGGDEQDLLPIAEAIAPGATVISPRGQVTEYGAPRFFRRFAEGVLDIEDWRERTQALADFVAAISIEHGIAGLIAVGFSNGANIAQGLLFLRPEALAAAVLIRPMFITDEVPANDLSGRQVLLLPGDHDPVVAPEDAQRIANQLQDRGARVTVKTVPASHGLVLDDITQVRAWLKARPQMDPTSRNP